MISVSLVIFSFRWNLPPVLGCTIKQPDSRSPLFSDALTPLRRPPREGGQRGAARSFNERVENQGKKGRATLGNLFLLLKYFLLLSPLPHPRPPPQAGSAGGRRGEAGKLPRPAPPSHHPPGEGEERGKKSVGKRDKTQNTGVSPSVPHHSR